ncbi:unnamed protein product [Brassica rapa subsp. trilocularis]
MEMETTTPVFRVNIPFSSRGIKTVTFSSFDHTVKDVMKKREELPVCKEGDLIMVSWWS